MKTNHIILSVLSLFITSALFAQKKDSLKVWGNCSMCEKTIETAAKSAGATSADWNTETKVLMVSYTSKTNLSKIEKSVAASGYDTQNLTAPEDAYNKLHSCCQYDRKSTVSTVKATSLIIKDDCCEDGETKVAMDCCKDGKCTTGTCIKDGKCTKTKDGKCEADCCKKA